MQGRELVTEHVGGVMQCKCGCIPHQENADSVLSQ